MHSLIALALLILPVFFVMRRDFTRGLCLALALFAVITDRLALEGGAFQFTFQRVLLLVTLGFWYRWTSRHRPLAKIPFLGLFIAWGVASLLSVIFSTSFGMSLKTFISFSTEVILFYIIVSTTLTDLDTVTKAFRALAIGIAVVGLFGVYEYYRETNLAMDLLGVSSGIVGDGDGILVTFQHRILLGYAMAMGWPLLLAWSLNSEGRTKKLVTLAILPVLACCYFPNSRGPWFGAALAGGCLYLLGSPKIRRSLQMFGILVALVIAVRPGVRATVVDLVGSTFEKDSYRGESARYRKELWRVAFTLVNSSPERALFGYGGTTTETMDISDKMPFGASTYLLGYSSWDNNYAADLVEYGYLGLGIEFALNGCILFALWRAARSCPPAYQDMAAAVFASAIIYVYALTNVYMFSPQLKCIFLTLVVIGTRLPMLAHESEEGVCPADEPGVEEAEPATATTA